MIWCGTYALDQGMAFTKVLFERQAEPGRAQVMSEREETCQVKTALAFVTSLVAASISLSSAVRSVNPGSTCLA